MLGYESNAFMVWTVRWTHSYSADAVTVLQVARCIRYSVDTTRWIQSTWYYLLSTPRVNHWSCMFYKRSSNLDDSGESPYLHITLHNVNHWFTLASSLSAARLEIEKHQTVRAQMMLMIMFSVWWIKKFTFNSLRRNAKDGRWANSGKQNTASLVLNFLLSIPSIGESLIHCQLTAGLETFKLRVEACRVTYFCEKVSEQFTRVGLGCFCLSKNSKFKLPMILRFSAHADLNWTCKIPLTQRRWGIN